MTQAAVLRGEGEIAAETLDQAFRRIKNSFDPVYGGFGNAPKFPTPHTISFLFRYGVTTGEDEAVRMAEDTLEGIMRGGIYDHIGGGFARYSTDGRWLVPHFEKMLYDNALMVLALLDGYQVTGREDFKRVAEETLAYVLREMTSPEGGFYSAEDADSEGVEGKYYLWSPQEVKEILGDDAGARFCRFFDISEPGNFEGLNIPNLIHADLNEIERELDFINSCKVRLLAQRDRRVHPYKDDKVLASWNGLMIAALARAYRILRRENYKTAAVQAVNFINSSMCTSDGRLLARYREGEAAIPGYANDYCFMVWGLLELYQATFESKYLSWAVELNRDLIRLFWDEEQGGFFLYGSDAEQLLVRPKEIYDGAMPSSNSIAALNLVQLSLYTGDLELEDKSSQILRVFAQQVKSYPPGYTALLIAAMHHLCPSREIVVVGPKGERDTQMMLDLINGSFRPNTVTILCPPASDSVHSPHPLNRALNDYVQIDGRATAYVCENRSCLPPATSLEELNDLLN